MITVSGKVLIIFMIPAIVVLSRFFVVNPFQAGIVTAWFFFLFMPMRFAMTAGIKSITCKANGG